MPAKEQARHHRALAFAFEQAGAAATDPDALVRHFAALQGGGGRYPVRPILPEAVERLQSMDWPGNVRELRNTVERLLILAPGPEVTMQTPTLPLTRAYPSAA